MGTACLHDAADAMNNIFMRLSALEIPLIIVFLMTEAPLAQLRVRVGHHSSGDRSVCMMTPVAQQ